MDKSENRSAELKISSNPALRILLLISGLLLTAIGILGIFLPLLPATIFFILAAWCFARSSEKFHGWLHNNRFFGKYLSNYTSGNGMTLNSKIMSIAMLWIGMIISAIWLTELIYVRILLALIGIGVTWHLLAIKTAPK
ncbi:MAG TPA: YbaN family protein [Ignavibacteria bacterium]|nr:YbaN family protein [Ignavibacteria bacterium]HQY52516.1 YbaN family protein [Ignavibacteria bacterium]